MIYHDLAEGKDWLVFLLILFVLFSLYRFTQRNKSFVAEQINLLMPDRFRHYGIALQIILFSVCLYFQFYLARFGKNYPVIFVKAFMAFLLTDLASSWFAQTFKVIGAKEREDVNYRKKNKLKK